MNPSKINELTRSVLSIARKTLEALVIFITAGIYLVYRRSGGDDLGVF